MNPRYVVGSDSSTKVRLTIRNRDDRLMWWQEEDTLQLAREAAIRITTVHGQKTWRVTITGSLPSGPYQIVYRKGKEVCHYGK